MNTKILNVVKQLIAEQGVEVLNDSRRVGGYLADMAAKEPKPQRMALVQCLANGSHRELQAADGTDRRYCKQRLAQKLHDEEGLDLTLCNDTLDLLEAVLWGETAQFVPEVSPVSDERTAFEGQQTVEGPKTSSESPGQIQANAMLRKAARLQLRGSWFPAIGMVFVYLCISGFAISLAGIGYFIIFGPLMLGFCDYFLKKTRGGTVTLNNLFSGFSMFGQGVLLNILLFVFTALWTLLLIVPGIVKSLSYSMAYYIMLDNPGMNAIDAITASRKMMNGHKRRLFCLLLSFIGWGLLCIPSFGIGLLWLIPYIALSQANFYEDLKNNSKQ
jgi:uncharacterized membrane protein